MLNLIDALFLLSLDDAEGEFLETAADRIESILSGAILAELVLRNRVEIVDERVVIINDTTMQDPILDKALYKIMDTAKPRKLRYWINTFAYLSYFEEIGHQLVDRGILTRKKKRLHLVFPYVEARPGEAINPYAIKKRLREIVLTNGDADASEEALLSFLYHGKLMKLIFTKDERKEANRWVKKLLLNENRNALSMMLEEIIILSCKIKCTDDR